MSAVREYIHRKEQVLYTKLSVNDELLNIWKDELSQARSDDDFKKVILKNRQEISADISNTVKRIRDQVKLWRQDNNHAGSGVLDMMIRDLASSHLTLHEFETTVSDFGRHRITEQYIIVSTVAKKKNLNEYSAKNVHAIYTSPEVTENGMHKKTVVRHFKKYLDS